MHLLSRHADCYFWLGRYIERAASLSRILQVQTAFDRGQVDGAGWSWILTLYDEMQTFNARGLPGGATPTNVIQYCAVDRDHSGSIASSIAAARYNARTLRALISTDFWMQISRLHARVDAMGPVDIAENRLAQTCQSIQTDCYALLGIAESTFYRDAGWRFFRLGLNIESADQMSRLLDVRFAQMKTGTADRGTLLGDFPFWTMLLRSCGGHHAYRRLIPGPLHPEKIARFLIFDQAFARSISHGVHAIDQSATELRTVCQTPTPAALLERISDTSDLLHTASQDRALTSRLHVFNDRVQRHLAGVAGALHTAYFDTAPTARATPSPAMAEDAAEHAGGEGARSPDAVGAGQSQSQTESQIQSQTQSQSQPKSQSETSTATTPTDGGATS